MARTYTPKINKHVTYYNASGKPQPATIVAVTSATVVNLRVGHATPLVGIARAPISSVDSSNVPNTWRPA